MAGANDLLPSHRINGFGYDRLSRRPEIRSLTSRPMLSLTVNYVTALMVTLLLLPLYPQRTTVSWSFRNVNWASYVVGVSIVGVELAVLLAYRVGWKISLASVVGSVTTALLLVAVGLLFFNEHLSPKNVAGIAFCLVGLALIAPR